MPATPNGRGAQVILSGDAQAAARGGYAPTFEANTEAMRLTLQAGMTGDGSRPDGSTVYDLTGANPLGAQLRRLSTQARFNNPHVNALMSSPPTITTSTTRDTTYSKLWQILIVP